MPTEIVPGVHDLTCAETPNGRIRAFLTDDGTLFDAGLPDSTEALLAEISATGVTPKRVVVTHADVDHVGGVEAVRDAYSVTVFVPDGADVGFDVDLRYEEGNEIAGFEAVHLPGHRAHQHGLVDESRAAGVAILADAASGADQRGLPAGYLHLPPGWFSEDLVLAEESLAKLLRYEFDAGLVYHGSSVTEGASETLRRYVGRLARA
jgi:glyoxylase-like metal-dependent hydrolase (beta-lactamase superfamily II)